RSVGADRSDDIDRQEFLAVAAVLKISVSSQHMRKLVGQNSRELRFIVHQSQQTGAYVNRTIWQSERVRLRIAQGAKVPGYVFRRQSARQKRFPHSREVS